MAIVPTEFQAIFFAKVIKYVRSPDFSGSKKFSLGLLYDPSSPDSKLHLAELFGEFKKTLEQQKSGSLEFSVVEVTVSNLATSHLDGLYLCKGFSPQKLAELLKIIRSKKLLNFTAEESYFNSGVMLGVKLTEGKTQIILNKSQSDASGIEFDSRFLQVAEIIK